MSDNSCRVRRHNKRVIDAVIGSIGIIVNVVGATLAATEGFDGRAITM